MQNEQKKTNLFKQAKKASSCEEEKKTPSTTCGGYLMYCYKGKQYLLDDPEKCKINPAYLDIDLSITKEEIIKIVEGMGCSCKEELSKIYIYLDELKKCCQQKHEVDVVDAFGQKLFKAAKY